MITIEEKTEKSAQGVAVIEEATGHAPIVGLVRGLKISQVCVAERDGMLYNWSFEWDPGAAPPDGIIIMENGELELFEEVDRASWLAFVLGNIQKAPVRCTLQHYLDSGVFRDAEIAELLYVDLLGRPADGPGLAAYLAGLAEGLGWDRIRADMLRSGEFRARGITVFDRLGRVFRFQSLMSEALKRDDIHGLHWIDIDRYKHLSNAAFCNAVYQLLVGRAPDQDGLKFYSWALHSRRLNRVSAARRILRDTRQTARWRVISSEPEHGEIVIEIPEDATPEQAAKRIEGFLGETLPEADRNKLIAGKIDVGEVVAGIQGRWDPFFSRIRVVKAAPK